MKIKTLFFSSQAKKISSTLYCAWWPLSVDHRNCLFLHPILTLISKKWLRGSYPSGENFISFKMTSVQYSCRATVFNRANWACFLPDQGLSSEKTGRLRQQLCLLLFPSGVYVMHRKLREGTLSTLNVRSTINKCILHYDRISIVQLQTSWRRKKEPKLPCGHFCTRNHRSAYLPALESWMILFLLGYQIFHPLHRQTNNGRSSVGYLLTFLPNEWIRTSLHSKAVQIKINGMA